MKRWHEDYKITFREWKKHHDQHVWDNLNRTKIGVSPYLVECQCDNQIGRFRKKDAFDCGNSKCYLCHSDKFPKRIKSKKEMKSQLGFKEQIKDFFEGTN